METILKGNALILGDNVDTDQIFPGRFLALTDPKEIGARCLSGIDETLAGRFPRGGIVVAGRNFGCGSSREHAPIALIHMGAAAVLADSFARIFFRNAINLGLPAVVCPGIAQAAENGDVLTVDLNAGTVALPDGRILPCEPLGPQAMAILQAGGIKPLMRAKTQG